MGVYHSLCSFLTQMKRVLLKEFVVFVSCYLVMLDMLIFGWYFLSTSRCSVVHADITLLLVCLSLFSLPVHYLWIGSNVVGVRRKRF
jgi:hypothetical protein